MNSPSYKGHISPPGSSDDDGNVTFPPAPSSSSSFAERLSHLSGICARCSYRNGCFLLSSVDALVGAVLLFRVVTFLVEANTDKRNDILVEAMNLPLIIIGILLRAISAARGFLAFRKGALTAIKRSAIAFVVNTAYTGILLICALLYTFCPRAELLSLGSIDPQKVDACWRLGSKWVCANAEDLCLAPSTLPRCHGCTLTCSFGRYTLGEDNEVSIPGDVHCVGGKVDPEYAKKLAQLDAANGSSVLYLRIWLLVLLALSIVAMLTMKRWEKALRGRFKWRQNVLFSLSMEEKQIRSLLQKANRESASCEMTSLGP